MKNQKQRENQHQNRSRERYLQKQLEDPKATKTKDPDLKTPEGTKKPDEVDQAEK